MNTERDRCPTCECPWPGKHHLNDDVYACPDCGIACILEEELDEWGLEGP